MKYPILYASDATDFFTLGLGPLKNTIKATVTEERNGSFYFEAEVLTDSPIFPLVLKDCLIKADAGHLLKDQRFRIKRIVPKHNGRAEIYAEHVSYLAGELSLKPEVGVTGSAHLALQQWQAAIVESNPFVVDSDITTSNSTKWRIDKVENPRQALGGVEGSILDTWGGEYRFDNYHISLLKKRGTTANTVLAYGRNITDFEQEENIAEVYTSVYPYAIYTVDDVEHLVTIDGYTVDSQCAGNYPNKRVLPIDFSSEFEHEEVPTKAKLKQLAEKYIKDNEVGVPKVSIRVSFLDLSKTTDYAEYKDLEQVNLCDDVLVYYPKLGVNTVAKVIRTVWNVLTESYDEIEIGEKRMTLATKLNEQTKQIKEINNQTNSVIIAANGKNMIFYGLFGKDGLGEPKATRIGDMWYKPNGEDTEFYIWDGTVWEFIMSTRETRLVGEKVDALEEEVKDAVAQSDEAVNKANQAVADAGFATNQANTAKDLASQAIGNANKAIGDAKTAYDTAQTSLNQAKVAADKAGKNELVLISHDEKLTEHSVEISQRLTRTQVDALVTGKGYATTHQVNEQVSRIDKDIISHTTKLEQITGYVDEVSDANPNLWNPKVATQGAISGSGAIFGTDIPDRRYMTMLPVYKETHISYVNHGRITEGGTTYTGNFAFYNSLGMFIEGSFQQVLMRIDEHQLITIPEGAIFVQFSLDVKFKHKVEFGDVPTPYISAKETGADLTYQSVIQSLQIAGAQLTADSKLNVTQVNNEIDKRGFETITNVTSKTNQINQRIDTVSNSITLTAQTVTKHGDRLTAAEGRLNVTDNKIGGLVTDVSGNKTRIGNLELTSKNFGVRIADTEKAVTDLGDANPNIWNPKIATQGAISGSGGIFGTDNPDRKYTDYLYISGQTHLSYVNYGWIGAVGGTAYTGNFAFYDADKNFISDTFQQTANRIGEHQLITVPSKAVWLRFSLDVKFKHKVEWGDKPTAYTVASVDDVITVNQFSDFQQAVNRFQTNVQDNIAGIKSQQTQLAGQITSVITDIDSITNSDKLLVPYWEQGTLSTATGTEMTSTTQIRSGFIKCKEGDRLLMYDPDNGVYTSSPRYWYYYDANKNFVSYTGYTSNSAKAVAPAGAHYFRVRTITSVPPEEFAHNVIAGDLPIKIKPINRSQFTQLQSAINMRVQSGKVIGEINVEAGKTILRQSDNVVMITPSTTYIQNATIKSAHLESVMADKITTGTLNAANVNIINLNVNKLVGNLTSFIQSNWNGISSQVSINSAGIDIGGTSRAIHLGSSGMQIFKSGTAVGYIRGNDFAGMTGSSGLVFNLETASDYMAWSARDVASDPNYQAKLVWMKRNSITTGGFYQGFTFTDPIRLRGGLYPDNDNTTYFLKFRNGNPGVRMELWKENSNGSTTNVAYMHMNDSGMQFYSINGGYKHTSKIPK